MALQFQGYGDPFARQKMEQQRRQQQFDNMNQVIGSIGQGVNNYQQNQRQQKMDGYTQDQQAREKFLFDRQYAPVQGPVNQPQQEDSNPFMGSFSLTQRNPNAFSSLDQSQQPNPALMQPQQSPATKMPQNGLSMFQGGQQVPQMANDLVSMHKQMYPHLAGLSDQGGQPQPMGPQPGQSRDDFEYLQKQQAYQQKQGQESQMFPIELDFKKSQAEKARAEADFYKTKGIPGQITPALDARISNQNRSAESQLRSQFLSQSKDFSDTATSYQRIIDSASNPTAAGDLSLIFNYMKMLDPGSTVREGEFATAQNAGSIPQSLVGQYNKAINGERLSPELRNDFVNRAKQLYLGQKQKHDQRVYEFKRIATDSGVNPENVVIDVSTPLGGFGGSENSQNVIVQRNKKTGERRQSNDGGKTWQILQ